MGILYNLFVVMGGGGYASYLAFKLGPELPIACRHFGQQIGMGYNYFKVILKVMKPQEEESGEIVELLRKTNQQTAALNRELRETFMRAKEDVKDEIPEEFTKNNPLKNLFQVAPDEPVKAPSDQASGNEFIYQTYQERKRIINKKKEKSQQSAFYKL